MGIHEEKAKIVDVIAEKLKNSKSSVVTDYRGLNVAEVTELRKQLRDNNVEYKVLKNTLLRRATEKTDYTALDEVLTGPTAVAFSPEDAVVAAKVINEFAKKHKALEIKGGIVEGQVMNAEQMKDIASLPSREGLISMFLSVLQAPIRNFALAVKAVAEDKEKQNA